MIEGLAILLALLLLRVTGGSLRALESVVTFKGSILVLSVLAVQGAARGRLAEGLNAGAFAVAIWGVAVAMLAAALWRSRSMVGVWLLVLGLILNLVVVLLNGAMPVAASGHDVQGFYSELDASTHLRVLADVLPSPGGSHLLSVGDILLLTGLVVFIVGNSRSSPGPEASPQGSGAGRRIMFETDRLSS